MKNVENMNLVLEKLEREIRNDYNAAKTLINTYDFLLDALNQGGIDGIDFYDNYGNFVRVTTANFKKQVDMLVNLKDKIDKEITYNLDHKDYKHAHTLSFIKGKTTSVLNELRKFIENNRF